MAVCTASITSAKAQPVDVASGDDLAAWQSLEHLRLSGDDAIAAYRAFVDAYTASPLAVMAYGRLVALDAATPWHDDDRHTLAVAALGTTWGSLQDALRDQEAPALATLDLTIPADDAVVAASAE